MKKKRKTRSRGTPMFKPGDRVVRMTSTGLWLFGLVLSGDPARAGMVPVKVHSKRDPRGTDVLEYEKALVKIPSKDWETCRSLGWVPTPVVVKMAGGPWA